MLRITLEQWRMFLAVVEHGGFNQASEAVFKSQSSIHHAVKKIEEGLGVRLFEVIGRKTVLTEAGNMMLRRASYLLSEAEKVETVGLTLSQGIETKLKLAVDEVFPRTVLYNALDTVSKMYPLLQIELFEPVLSGSNEQLKADEVEIAISPISLGAGLSESLAYVEFQAVASAAHSLHAIDRPLSLEDLKSYRQIVVRDSARDGPNTRVDEGWLEANHRWTVGHLHSSIDIICNGLGYAWLPVHLITTYLNDKTLKPLNLKNSTKRTTQLFLTIKDSDQLGPAAKYFAKEIMRQCSAFTHRE